MNEKLKSLMLNHGLEKYISADCQARVEMIYQLTIDECCKELIEQGYIILAKDIQRKFDNSMYNG